MRRQWRVHSKEVLAALTVRCGHVGRWLCAGGEVGGARACSGQAAAHAGAAGLQLGGEGSAGLRDGLALPTIESTFFRAEVKRPRQGGQGLGALCAASPPLAPWLRVSHLSVGGQLDTRPRRVHLHFPIRLDWEHPASTLPVSYTVEGAECHMGISERSPPRVMSCSRNPLALRCRT
jgi:hypothetical protein